MFNLRFKRIQSAMADGQLDEACRLIEAEDVGGHRKGQKLKAKLAQAMARRGREHLAAERLEQALSDCNKSDQLGGNRAEMAELRREICKRMEAKQYAHRQRNDRLAQAQDQMDKGWLSVGEQLLGDVEHAEADILMQQADAKRKVVDDAVAKAELALGRDDIEEAIEIIRRAGASINHSPRIGEQIGRIRASVVKSASEYLNGGRVDLAATMLGRLACLDGDSIEVKQLEDAVRLCAKAAEAISVGQCREAMSILAKLKLVLPQAKWVEAARSQAQKSAEALESLASGPLGLASFESRIDPGRAASLKDETPVEAAPAGAVEKKEEAAVKGAGVIGSKFVLQIDGVGAFCVLRDAAVSVGPISSSRRPTLGLMAPSNLPVARIERQDEDYFLRADSAIGVNDEIVTEKLLAGGDRIALSQRCRMKFDVPNAASNTATLALSSAKLARPDINQVILMDRDIVVGPNLSDHIRTADGKMTFYVRDGRMCCRTQDPVIVEGREFDGSRGLPLDTPIRIGRLGVVLVCEKEGLPV